MRNVGWREFVRGSRIIIGNDDEVMNLLMIISMMNSSSLYFFHSKNISFISHPKIYMNLYSSLHIWDDTIGV